MNDNRRDIAATVTVPTGDVFTARAMAALLNTARQRQDGSMELEMSPEMFELVLVGMERDGIALDSEFATVSAAEAGEIANLRPKGL